MEKAMPPAIILCGGRGTRLRDVAEVLPKPMVPIGDQPIVWHIMRCYAAFNVKRFILCLGYKREAFIDYFANYRLRASDVTLTLGGDSFRAAARKVVTVRDAAEIMRERWPRIEYTADLPEAGGPYEARTLRLDCSKAARELGWRGIWSARRALRITADWYRDYYERGRVDTAGQFRKYIGAAEKAGAAWIK